MGINILNALPRAVRFTGEGGHDHELKTAMKLLKVGEVYHIRRIEVGGFHTAIMLKEVPGPVWFNGVQFGEVEQ